MGMPFGDVDRIAKLIPDELNITIDQAIQFIVSCGVVVPVQQQQKSTSEIGIKMALGARSRSILRQFLAETLILTAVGGSTATDDELSAAIDALDDDFPIRQYDKILFNPKHGIPVDFEGDNRLFVVPIEDIVAVFRKE